MKITENQINKSSMTFHKLTDHMMTDKKHLVTIPSGVSPQLHQVQLFSMSNAKDDEKC